MVKWLVVLVLVLLIITVVGCGVCVPDGRASVNGGNYSWEFKDCFQFHIARSINYSIENNTVVIDGG